MSTIEGCYPMLIRQRECHSYYRDVHYYVFICPAHCLLIGYDASRHDKNFFVIVESKPNRSGTSGQISSWFWRMPVPVQLQCVQLIMDITNACEVSNGVFILLISEHDEKKYQIHCRSINSSKLANSDATKEALNCNASL